jgi:hypothetical protein
MKNSLNIFLNLLEFQRDYTHQECLQLIPACPANRRRLTEMNSSTVKAVKHFHEIVDVHGARTQLISFKALEDFFNFCFDIEIHRHILEIIENFVTLL